MIPKNSSLRIWWECRKLFQFKWFAISLGIFSVSWPMGLISQKPYLLAYVFGVLAFLHASFTASIYAHIFARKAYPLLPNKEVKGLYFSLIEFALGWLLLGALYCFFATAFKHSSSILLQNTLMIGACWAGTWVIWLLCRFSISQASLQVLLVVLIAGEKGFFVLLSLIAITWAAAVHLSIKRQLGEDQDNLLMKLFEKRGSVHFIELFCFGPKLTSIPSFPSVAPGRFLMKVFVAGVGFLLLLIGCMILAFYVFDLISFKSVEFSFKRLSFIYFYSCLVHLMWKISLFNALENCIPSFMSMSRESWLKTRLQLKRMERIGTLLALLAVPLFVDLGLNWFIKGTWAVSEEYLGSLWGIFMFIPLYFTLSFVLFFEKDLKLFSQNRRGVLGSPFKQHSTDVRWTAIGITVLYSIFCGAVAIAIAVNDVPLSIFKTPYTWSFLATIYFGYLIWAYRYENKLETKAFREGDLV